jgi:regulator of sigma E protease
MGVMNPGGLAWYFGAFIVALGLLVIVHELGHFLVAFACRVKILRFSVGFGRPLWSRRFGRDGTEWAVAAFPLGGFVKMLDEREGPVAPEEVSRAFNRQPVGRRALIVVAGPTANLLLAVLIYWVLFMHGAEELRPILAAPVAGTAAAAAGVREGETVRAVSGIPIQTLQDLRWELTQRVVNREPVSLELTDERGDLSFANLDISALDVNDLDQDLLEKLGLALFKPPLKPVIGQVGAASVAGAAGLRAGDEIVGIDGRPTISGNEVVSAIRAAPGRELALQVKRGESLLEVRVTPTAVQERGKDIGRIGITVGDAGKAHSALMIEVRYGPIAALERAVRQTWDTSALSLRLIGRMIVGELSWKNLSGPVTIADYAGQSASMGLVAYLKFLALISISLGVLNLLPIPILDGGHLMYYLLEVIKGGPLSERATEIGQQIGLSLLALLMAFAFYNDINRLVSG